MDKYVKLTNIRTASASLGYHCVYVIPCVRFSTIYTPPFHHPLVVVYGLCPSGHHCHRIYHAYPSAAAGLCLSFHSHGRRIPSACSASFRWICPDLAWKSYVGLASLTRLYSCVTTNFDSSR